MYLAELFLAAVAAAVPSATPAPAATSLANGPHAAIVRCGTAALYSWPDPAAAPFLSTYPALLGGEPVRLVGAPVLSLDGRLLVETDVPVLAPFGAGGRYWVLRRCVV